MLLCCYVTQFLCYSVPNCNVTPFLYVTPLLCYAVAMLHHCSVTALLCYFDVTVATSIVTEIVTQDGAHIDVFRESRYYSAAVVNTGTSSESQIRSNRSLFQFPSNPERALQRLIIDSASTSAGRSVMPASNNTACHLDARSSDRLCLYAARLYFSQERRISRNTIEPQGTATERWMNSLTTSDGNKDRCRRRKLFLA